MENSDIVSRMRDYLYEIEQDMLSITNKLQEIEYLLEEIGDNEIE